MGEHTPGPWEAEFGESVHVLDHERGRICTVNWLRGPHGSFGRRTDAEGEANARLIAAAPEMLRALIECLSELEGARFYSLPAQRMARAAIAKATTSKRGQDVENERELR